VGIKDKLLSSATAVALNTAAIIAFVLLALGSWRVAGFVAAAIALALLAWKSGPSVIGVLAVTCGLLAVYGRDLHHTSAALIVTGLLAGFVIINQPILTAIIDRTVVRAANLDGYRPDSGLMIEPERLRAATPAFAGVIGVFAAARLPVWPLAIIAGLAAATVAAVGLQAVRLRVRGGGDEARIRAALERHDARFVLHFSAPDATEYHVEMWRPYLERIGLPWAIVVREEPAFTVLASDPRVPVVYCPLISDLDTVVTPGLRAVFYVNNGMKNAHFVRISHLTHIQLLHGDSDKASSFNPVTAMFDRIFVAGQAGIDRYAANGVSIPPDRFDIVGRPQVEAINVARRPIRDVANPVVLYATTWFGVYDDARYSSLPIGTTILAKLLERGATVILRPHPYTGRHLDSVRHLDRLTALLAADRARTGRPHVFGAAATTGMSLFECANRADALISDVSGVASDFLYSEKPFALTNMRADTAETFVAAFPLANAAYVIDSAAANLDEVLDSMLGPDPLDETRRKVKAYYLGEFSEDHYAQGFVEAARAYCV
jgi:hypothetical protein